MDPSPSIIIWRVRHDHHQFRCVVEQMAEECFALRLFRGREVLLTEFFGEPEPLLARAAELRRRTVEHHAVAV